MRSSQQRGDEGRGRHGCDEDPVAGKAGAIENGLFVDAAMDLVEQGSAAHRRRLDQALAKAQEILLAVGITAAADMGTCADDWAAMQPRRRGGQAERPHHGLCGRIRPLREVIGGSPTPLALRRPAAAWAASNSMPTARSARAAPGSSSPMPTSRTRAGCSSYQRRRTARPGRRRRRATGFQIAIHAIGDAANAQVISAPTRALGQDLSGDRRWRIEHFQIADPADIPRLAPAGIIASMQPTHQTSDRLMAEKRLGPDRLAGAYAWQTVLKSRRAASPSAPISRWNRPTPSPASRRRSAGRT